MATRFPLLHALSLVASLLALAACGGSGGSAPQHILMISVDTLRADHLGCYGHAAPTSPSIDGLAAQGALFERVQAPRGLTWPSLVSLLTGKYPITHGVHNNGIEPAADEVMLMHDLRAAGYATGAFISNCEGAFKDAQQRGLDRLIASHEPPMLQDKADRETADAAMQWLDEHREGRSFTWVHLMNPHRPYMPPAGTEALLAPYQGFAQDGVKLPRVVRAAKMRGVEQQLERALTGRYALGQDTYRSVIEKQEERIALDQLLDLITLADMPLTQDDLRYILSRYDAEVRGTDMLVGELLAKLDALGISDRTLVVFTSDHGEELYEHNRYFFHSSSIYESVLHVPLIVRWPGQVPAVRVPHLVENIDVLPTILELAHLPQREAIEGRSLLPMVQNPAVPLPRVAVAELWTNPEGDGDTSRTIYSVRDGRWKLIVNPTGAYPRGVPHSALPDAGFRIEREELYDLDNDPHEQADLLRASAPEPGKANDLATATYLARAYAARNRLQAALEDWRARRAGAGTRLAQATDDAAQLEELAAIGYVDAPPLTAPAAEPPTILATIHELATRIAAAEQPPAEAPVLLAASAVWSGRREEAAAALEAARTAARPKDRPQMEALARELGLPLTAAPARR